MPELATKPRPRAKYGRDAFKQIFDDLGLKTDLEKATFLGVAESTFNRTRRGLIRPGEDFISSSMYAVYNEPRLQGHSAANFEQLFPIVETEAS